MPGNPYANMETLLGLEPSTSYGNGATVTVTANDVSNPIMKSYTAGQIIQTPTPMKVMPRIRPWAALSRLMCW